MIKNQKIFQTLLQLGLSNAEVLAYLEIYKIGSMPTSGVARRLNLNRSTIRYTLENLVKKSFLIKSEKNGTFYYVAKDPEDIIKVIKKQRVALKEQETAVSQISGDLKKLKNPNSTLPKVRFFEGFDGLIEMYEDFLHDSLTMKCDIYAFTNIDQDNFHPGVWSYIKNVYTPARIKAGNSAYALFNNDADNAEYQKNNDKTNRYSLFLPKDKFKFQTCFHIYGNKVAFYSRQKNETPNGLIIQSKTIADDQRSLFSAAWEYAKSLPINKSYKNLELPHNIQ